MQARVLAVLVLAGCADGYLVEPLAQDELPATYRQVDVLVHHTLGDVRCASDAWGASLLIEADGQGRKATLTLEGPAFVLDAGTLSHCEPTGELDGWTLRGVVEPEDPAPGDPQARIRFSGCDGDEAPLAAGTVEYDASRARLLDVSCAAAESGPLLLSVAYRELYRD